LLIKSVTPRAHLLLRATCKIHDVSQTLKASISTDSVRLVVEVWQTSIFIMESQNH